MEIIGEGMCTKSGANIGVTVNSLLKVHKILV